jgi:NADH-quinone oxidoreductase subunit H
MTSVTPTRPTRPNLPLLIAAVAGVVVLAIVVVALYAFFFGGGAAAFGRWMYASALGVFVRYLLESLLLLVCILLSTAVLIYAERKIWGSIHLRRGPNVVGPWGVLQPFADFLKFILKEPIIPAGANKGVFLFAPLVSVTLALAAWAVIPVADGWAISDINVGVLYLFAVSSLGVYGVIMAGWASNSKYPLMSALRVAAQMVSYEVSIGFVIVTVLSTRRIRAGACSAGTGCRCCRCSSSSSFRRWPRRTGRRSTWPRRSRSWSPATWSNIRRRCSCCSSSPSWSPS